MNQESTLLYWPILKNIPEYLRSQIRSFMVLTVYENKTKDSLVAITGDGRVFQYNLQDNVATKLEIVDKQIVEMGHGLGHVLARTECGEVLVWGDNSEGQLGNGTTIGGMQPTVVNFGAKLKISMIRCCNGHNLAVTNAGQVYAWGMNLKGQCGLGHRRNQLTPTKITGLQELVVVKVECGSFHSMALTNNGLVYSWGSNQNGQLGIGNDNTQRSLVKMAIAIGYQQPKVKDIACGYYHSLVLTEQGTIYGCGYNSYRQVGSGSTESSLKSYVKISCDDETVRFTSIYALCNFSAAISDTGFCYVWGQLKVGIQPVPLKTNLHSMDMVLAIYSPNMSTPRLIQLPCTSNSQQALRRQPPPQQQKSL